MNKPEDYAAMFMMAAFVIMVGYVAIEVIVYNFIMWWKILIGVFIFSMVTTAYDSTSVDFSFLNFALSFAKTFILTTCFLCLIIGTGCDQRTSSSISETCYDAHGVYRCE